MAAHRLVPAPVLVPGASLPASTPDGETPTSHATIPIGEEGSPPVVPGGQHETRIVRLRVRVLLFVEATVMVLLGDDRLVMSAVDMADAVGPGLLRTLSAPADLVADHTLALVHGRGPYLILRIRDTAEVEAVRVQLVGSGGVTVVMILGIVGLGHQEISFTKYHETM